MPKFSNFIIFIVLFCLNLTFSQETLTDSKNISKKVAEYYFYDRETIHLHLNKNQYFTSEEIWFKGYIYNRKTHLPFVETNNVYVVLYDEKGRKIQTKLFFADQGFFTGSLSLNNRFPSGRYFIQTFTNWMNNFYEDESSIFSIEITNTADTEYIPSSIIRPNDLKAVFTAESGVYLKGFNTTIGIQITDCFSNGIKISSGKIIDAKGETVTTFMTDNNGFGKFESNQSYDFPLKAVYEYNNKSFIEPLEDYVFNGVSISVNNTIFNDKTIIVARKNNTPKEQNDQFYLVIYQNEKSIIQEFKFDYKNEVVFSIPKADLFHGINSLLIVDKSFNSMCERLIFNPFSEKINISLTKGVQTKDTVTINGEINREYAELSISVLPAESTNLKNKTTLFSTFYSNAIVKNNINIMPLVYTTKNRIDLINLDTALLHQKNKTNWSYIMKNAPRSSFEFDKGLTIKGKINEVLIDAKKYQVELFSLPYNLNIKSPINEKNEFIFENLALADSLMLNLTLLKDQTKTREIKMYYTISNANRNFIKKFSPDSLVCKTSTMIDNYFAETSKPLFKENTIYLDNVDLIGESKKNFKHINTGRNSSYRSFKISGTDKSKLLRITDFLQQQGFGVLYDNGQLNIYARGGNREQRSPAIYLDDILLLEYSILDSYDMNQIDEIYIDAYYDSYIQGNATQGIIKIYTLPGYKMKSDYSDTKSIIVKGGFTKNTTFKNKEYYTYDDAGFQNHGVIHWEPTITITNGTFKLKFPHFNQNQVQLKIEGMTKNGELISEIITLNL